MQRILGIDQQPAGHLQLRHNYVFVFEQESESETTQIVFAIFSRSVCCSVTLGVITEPNICERLSSDAYLGYLFMMLLARLILGRLLLSGSGVALTSFFRPVDRCRISRFVRDSSETGTDLPDTKYKVLFFAKVALCINRPNEDYQRIGMYRIVRFANTARLSKKNRAKLVRITSIGQRRVR